MKTVFLVTCPEVGNQDNESILLLRELAKRGIKTSIQNWDDQSVYWRKADLVINRTTSSYLFNPRKYLEWAKKVEKTTTLWNSSRVLEWNHHKRYVIKLQKAGIRVPETILIPQNTEKSIHKHLENIQWEPFILKPCIGAGSCGLKQFTKQSPDLESHFHTLNRDGFSQKFVFGTLTYPASDTLVQPYLSEIEEYGEASLIYFGGEYSHGVLKKPKQGDFRAHPIWGADVMRYDASGDEVNLGYSGLGVVGYPTEYARIDMIPKPSDPIIIEIELIEPLLFFDLFPETVKTYAEHIENHFNR